jgi:actin-like protein 6A
MLELLFEKFHCEGLFIKSSACLSSYLFSKESSLIIDIGGHNTFVTPVHDGFQINEKVKHFKFGGENLTFSLDSFLMNKKPELFDFSFFRRNKIKGTPLENFSRLELIRDIKHSTFKVPINGISKQDFNPIVDNLIYELPDKRNIILAKESFSIADELFGSNEFPGIHKIVQQVIQNLNPDYKSAVMSNIIITGGATSTKGFIERLQREIYDQLCNYKSKFFYLNRQIDRRISSWLNGSVIGSMENFDEFLMTSKEYQEHGLSLIDRKC